MEKLRVTDFDTWHDYYWAYQEKLTCDWLIPYLNSQNIFLEGKKILEIGCGDGGVIASMAASAQKAVGLDINYIDHTKAKTDRVQYIQADVFDPETRPVYDDKYDLILLRDVIEHIPNNFKSKILNEAATLLKPGGKVLVTFPPYYSAFGSHQQVYSKTKLGKLPYVHVLTGRLYVRYVTLIEKGNQKAIALARELYAARTSIRFMKACIASSKLEIFNAKYFLVRPSHQLRYGVKARVTKVIPCIPVLREILILGAYVILQNKNGA